jgi:membrane-associated phospholipid phosphatase
MSHFRRSPLGVNLLARVGPLARLRIIFLVISMLPREPSGAVPISQEPSDSRCLANAIAFSLLLLGAAVLALNPGWFDRPLARAINDLTRDREFANALAFALAYPTLQGIIVILLAWSCWFSGVSVELRARLVGGAIAAMLAALIAGVLNRTLPTSPHPIFDAAIELHPPSVLGDIVSLRAESFPNSHTFPSERATLFAGLSIAIVQVRPKLGFIALGCTIAAEVSRIYLGLHYPADIFGSFSLAAGVAWLARMRWGSDLGRWFVRWEGARAGSFYISAILASYQIATGFQDLRNLAATLLR